MIVAGCRIGFDPVVSVSDASAPVQHRLDVIFYQQLTTCIVGDSCMNGCVSLRDDAGTEVVKLGANATAVLPGDPLIMTSEVAQCLTLTLDAGELATLHDTIAGLVADLESASGGRFLFDLRIHDITATLAMARYADVFWINPIQIDTTLLSPDTDFVLSTTDIRDDATGLHLPNDYCGLSYHADNGVVGAGYAWLPHTKSAIGAECADLAGYRYQFLNQLWFAVRNLTPGFSDAYGGMYPACGAGGDPLTWFPEQTDCMMDPDWSGCGQSPCDVGFVAHMFAAHWDPARPFFGNHCRDGVMDYGETGVDTGGNCLPR